MTIKYIGVLSHYVDTAFDSVEVVAIQADTFQDAWRELIEYFDSAYPNAKEEENVFIESVHAVIDLDVIPQQVKNHA